MWIHLFNQLLFPRTQQTNQETELIQDWSLLISMKPDHHQNWPAEHNVNHNFLKKDAVLLRIVQAVWHLCRRQSVLSPYHRLGDNNNNNYNNTDNDNNNNHLGCQYPQPSHSICSSHRRSLTSHNSQWRLSKDRQSSSRFWLPNQLDGKICVNKTRCDNKTLDNPYLWISVIFVTLDLSLLNEHLLGNGAAVGTGTTFPENRIFEELLSYMAMPS